MEYDLKYNLDMVKFIDSAIRYFSDGSKKFCMVRENILSDIFGTIELRNLVEDIDAIARKFNLILARLAEIKSGLEIIAENPVTLLYLEREGLCWDYLFTNSLSALLKTFKSCLYFEHFIQQISFSEFERKLGSFLEPWLDSRFIREMSLS